MVAEAARAGDNFFVIKELPVSMPSPFLFPGDLVEIRPNGIPATTGMLYEINGPVGTDSSG